ncbi:hypothetical protein C5C74_01610 [Rathayibacter sp. AY1E8]|nr:hypothetical protein C5C74_01610 [Rathayibacter sp. AY1E8]PPI02795.1 hypothetical protein C5C95_00950 [Rathayibacter sp. AY1B7]
MFGRLTADGADCLAGFTFTGQHAFVQFVEPRDQVAADVALGYRCRECAEAGAPLSFDHHGEQLTTGSSADHGRPPWVVDPPPQSESGTIEPTIPE